MPVATPGALGSPYKIPKRKRLTHRDLTTSSPPSTPPPKKTCLQAPQQSSLGPSCSRPPPCQAPHPPHPAFYPSPVKPTPSAKTAPASSVRELEPLRPPRTPQPAHDSSLKRPKVEAQLAARSPRKLAGKAPVSASAVQTAHRKRIPRVYTKAATWTMIASPKAVDWAVPQATFADMPIELVQSIHIYSGSDALPLVNKHMHQVLGGVNYCARWSLYNFADKSGAHFKTLELALDGILRRRFCTQEVVERILELWSLREERRMGQQRLRASDAPSTPRLRASPPLIAKSIPRRLVRASPSTPTRIHPLILWLFTTFKLTLDLDSSQGYALKRAALDGNYELVEWLLKHGASVTKNKQLCFKAAILNNDLRMMKLLLEPGWKRREDGTVKMDNIGDPVKHEDRMQPPQEWMHLALENRSKDIVLYLVDKGLTPNLDQLMKLNLRKFGDEVLDMRMGA